ncbi:MAG: hypothetical protein QF707_04190 [Candidatus Poseidoniaceae archaeon]|jgi:5S rRNA maturation endonuclease (ribonuclease M5)|nr:hypothetical protein [Candidatus Poseidoniaceae archaeon]MDP7202743.1 hypothetical protein [Candidatus Poseidoniaceae archaeon]|tara:strand:+ start:55 stop:579 length:525 start_codon:yes stop_codon:yes gene_type:complete
MSLDGQRKRVRKNHFSNANNGEERKRIAAEVLAEARKRNRPVKLGGSGCPILIEGKRDKNALLSLLFEGELELVNRGWSLEKLAGWFAQRLQHKNPVDAKESIILLMDWDRTGGRLQNELRRRLRAFDISVDETTRNTLMRALKPETCVVEDLHSMTEELLPLLEELDPSKEAE